MRRETKCYFDVTFVLHSNKIWTRCSTPDVTSPPKTVRNGQISEAFWCLRRRSDLHRRLFVPRFQPLAGVYRWGRHATGRVSYFQRSNGRLNPHQTKQDRSAISAVISYDPKFRRPLKRTFRRTEILLLSKRKRYVKRTFRRTKTRKNLRSNRYLATEKPVKMQENSD